MRRKVRYTFCLISLRSFACVGVLVCVCVLATFNKCMSLSRFAHLSLTHSLSLAFLGKTDMISACEKALRFHAEFRKKMRSLHFKNFKFQNYKHLWILVTKYFFI